jgi:ADP-heptose:LPS heptosyltransferase
MRWIDRRVGVPACAFLTLVDRLDRALRPRVPRKQGARILFIELSEMGSMVAAMPALAKAKALSPDSQAYFLTFAKNRKCLDLLGVIPKEQVFCIRDSGLGALLGDAFRVLRDIRRLRMDYVVDMEVFSRVSALLTGFCGGAWTSGFHSYYAEGLYRGGLHTHRVNYNAYQHIGHNFLALVRVLFQAPGREPLLKEAVSDTPLRVDPLPVEAAARDAVRAILAKAGWTPRPEGRLILVNPNGGLLPIRAWPLDNYIELIRGLLAHADWTVTVMGIDGAVQDAAAIRAAIGPHERLLDVTNAFGFDQLIPLFDLADLLVTNDGGPAHFAALADCDSLVFFGPETPLLYGPISGRAETLYSHHACSPCLSAFNHRHSTCTDNQCLKAIPVARVLDRAEQKLSLRSPRPHPPRPE